MTHAWTLQPFFNYKKSLHWFTIQDTQKKKKPASPEQIVSIFVIDIIIWLLFEIEIYDIFIALCCKLS
jgi:hypothetical protein